MTHAATLDLTNLAQDLGAAGKNAPQAMNIYMRNVSGLIAAAMVSYVPVKTGALKSSIQVQEQGSTFVIGPVGIPYAAFVEFGTGTRGEFPKSPRPGRQRVNGVWVQGRQYGQKAQPYARPAAKQYLDSLGDGAANVGVEMIVGPKAK